MKRIPLLVLTITLLLSCNSRMQNLDAVNEAMRVENIAEMFLEMDRYFPTVTVRAPPRSDQLPQQPNTPLPDSFAWQGMRYSSEQFFDSTYTQGLLVLREDTIRYERYALGQHRATPHIAWSLSKSVVSALFGIALAEGHIKSVEQTVEEYLPELAASGYAGVRIEDVLQMSSGIAFDETYGDPDSDINRYWYGFIEGKSQDDFVATLRRERPPGSYHRYISLNTHVLAMILSRATGRSLADYMTEKLWQPLGAEYDAYWLTDNNGRAMALGGLNATLRDYGRIGQLYLHAGNWRGRQLIPAAWVQASTTATAAHLQPQSPDSAHPGIGYGYQWWLPEGEEGEFMAIGVQGQYIYVNPSRATVIVKTSANRNRYESTSPYAQTSAHLAFFRAIAKGGRKD